MNKKEQILIETFRKEEEIDLISQITSSNHVTLFVLALVVYTELNDVTMWEPFIEILMI